MVAVVCSAPAAKVDVRAPAGFVPQSRPQPVGRHSDRDMLQMPRKLNERRATESIEAAVAAREGNI